MSTLPPLTVSAAVNLGAIVDAAIGNKLVARVQGHNVIVGTARSIGDENGNHAGQADVRTCLLRVTTVNGFEAFWPVSELIDEVGTGYFVTNYEA